MFTILRLDVYVLFFIYHVYISGSAHVCLVLMILLIVVRKKNTHSCTH